MDKEEKVKIFVISDSLGETAEMVALASKIQFNHSVDEIKKFSFILKESQIDDIIEIAKNEKCIILYTLVIYEMKMYLKTKAKKYNLVAIDLLGPIIKSLEEITGTSPKREAGLNRRLTSLYFQKIEAIEFAVKNDDGKNSKGFHDADIVLIGISRTSKTPLSMYLAYKNYKVSNYPLVPEIELPRDLFEISSKKIIGLTNNPDELKLIRRERIKEMGLKDGSSYADINRIFAELEYSENLFKKLNCPVINVSSRAIEETANIIISIINSHGGKNNNEQ